MNKSKTKIILIFILFLLLIKTDYRLGSTINCCGDDFDYYSHAYTIAVDFDFNYENQIPEYSKFYYTNGEKIAPVGFSGSGLLAAPFLFIGNILDNVLNYSEKPFNFKIMFYSLSSLVYLTVSAILLQRSFLLLNKNIRKTTSLLLLSGSGVAYFALERFSMTHVYEVFVNALIIYLSTAAFKTGKKIYFAFIPFSIFLGLLVKLSNFYIVLIPLIIKELLDLKFSNKIFNLKNRINFFLGFLLSTIFFIYINLKIYGKVILNPSETYSAQSQLSNYLESSFNIIEFALDILSTLNIVVFSQEFGIFWFSPAIFILLFFNVYYLLQKKYLLFFYISIALFSNIAIVNLWQSLGSSYGFRYLYSLIPLGIFILYASNFRLKEKIFKFYLLPFSIFGLISVFIFEATPYVQLTTYEVVNSFGRTIRYSQPEYLPGVFQSLFIIDGYLKLFATSFFGLIVFKLFIIAFEVNGFYDFLDSLGLPLENQDFVILIEKLEIITSLQIAVFTFVVYLCTRQLVKK
jgi:hypothetical protein